MKPKTTPKRSPVPPRLIRTKSDDAAIEAGCYYDRAAADHAVNFTTRYLRHSKGQWAGKPFVLLEWEEWEVVRPLFGWRRADGTRRFRKSFIAVPKKNGKSTLMAALTLYLLIGDREAGAEIYTAAADREQAGIVFGEAANMVRQSPDLAARLIVVPSTKRIADPLSMSCLRALSADVPTKEGLNAHGLVFDELHAQKSRTLWDALEYAGAARRQPLHIAITTAGVDRQSICYSVYEYAKKLLAGVVIDTSFYALIYEAEEADDWTDPAVWEKANPSWGTTIDPGEMAEAFAKARDMATQQNNFRRYRLNQWVGQVHRWLDMERWRACARPRPPWPAVKPDAYGGIDLAAVEDITAYVQLIPSLGNLVRCWFFLPEETMRKRVKERRIPYDVWARDGFVTVTRGNVVDEDVVLRTILETAGDVRLREVGFDPWNSTHLVTKLQDEGLKLVPVRQGFFTLNAPSKELEKLVALGALNHQGNPVLEWMANNVAVNTDAAGNIKPDKEHSSEKIDGISALVVALSRVILQTKPKGSKYDREGPTVL